MAHRRSATPFPVLLALVALAGHAGAQPVYDLIVVDSFNPTYGLRETYLWDINNSNVASGMTTQTNVIGYPGIVWEEATGKRVIPITHPRGLSDTGYVAGVAGVHNLVTSQTWLLPTIPGTYLSPIMLGVNDAGTAVGYIQTCNCSNSQGTLQIPYVWDEAGGARTLPVPGATGLLRINDQGVAIGWTGASSAAQGFFVDVATGAHTTMDQALSGAVGFGPTRAYDINDGGEIVGTRYGAGSVSFYGYIYTPGSGATIMPFPGGAFQQAVKPLGISNSRVVVGEIYVNGSARAFAYTQAEGYRDLNDPGTVAGIPPGFVLMSAQKVNDHGWIVGYGMGGGGFSRGFVLKPRAGVCRPDLTTGAVAGQPGYGVPNGVLNNEDFFYYLAQFAAGNAAVADLTTGAVPAQPGYGVPNGVINNEDFFYYLALFAAGC